MNEYSFKGRLDSLFPSQIMIDVTEVCNLKCIHCEHPEFKLSGEYHGYQLDPNLNKKLIDEISLNKTEKTQYVRYTSNGEPLLHKQSHEMIDYAVKNSGIKVTLTTNGTILKENKIKEILNSGLHLIDISIDAHTDETYKIVRGGNLQVTKKNIMKLIEIRDSLKCNTKIVVSFIEQNQNTNEIRDFYDFWIKYADDVVLRRLHSNSGSDINLIKRFYYNEEEEKRRPCLYPWERVVLNAKGMLSYCPTDWYGMSEICDYRNSTVKETWQSLYYDNLRNEHLNNNFKQCKFCKNCPDWKYTKWPHHKEKSYADLVERVVE